ncbi:globin family protein [Roseisolibacter sp. H3M3-2]|uniref:globin family protein n=1 Tax=Roseisolibacter sp. H3M3-2 TaxID=3031323 RepID=UPI0023DBE405|nr:globin family protein [Roseisolibacter sp. H3M3-2]MDF1504576.1 globin family protein [Roseisolibacter sp. H3M3-2]
MRPDQTAHIRRTWDLVAPIAPQAAELFYGRLFELDPSLRRLFAQADMQAQGLKLMQTLAVVVAGLDDLPRIVGSVQALGRRHVGYGVQRSHYATVGAALLWTLEQGLGDRFDAPARAAWTDAYALLSTTMIEAQAAAA